MLNFKHAFSTKIADCYKLGIPFFMYAPIEIASTQYGLETNPDFVATSKEELKTKLKNAIGNKVTYKMIIKKKRISPLLIFYN